MSTQQFHPPKDRFTPFAPGIMDDPYPWYRILREQDPVHFNPDLFGPGYGAWFLSCYKDVLRAELDTETFVRGRYGQMAIQAMAAYPSLPVYENNIFLIDPPHHTAQHALIRGAFTKAKMEQWRLPIARLAEEMVHTLLKGSDDGSIELIEQFCIPFTLTIFANLFGIPGPDRMAVLAALRKFTRTTDPITSQEVKAEGDAACTFLLSYFTELIAERRAKPLDDLLSSLVQQVDAADNLTPDDLLSLCIALPVAGYENITNLIGLAIIALMEHPDQLALLLHEPALMSNVSDEALRYLSSTQFNLREARTDVSFEVPFGSVTIPAGSIVFLLLGSANRDETQFPEPDHFELRRNNSRDHLGFGKGKHYCLGDPLTHIEVEETLRAILPALSSMRLEGFTMAPTRLFWGPQELLLRVPD